MRDVLKEVARDLGIPSYAERLQAENTDLKDEVKKLRRTLKEVRDLVLQICTKHLGRECNCGPVTQAIDKVLEGTDADHGKGRSNE